MLSNQTTHQLRSARVLAYRLLAQRAVRVRAARVKRLDRGKMGERPLPQVFSVRGRIRNDTAL